MLGLFSQRLFPLLQLTRMALVFTAISNSLCTLLISVRARYGPSDVLERLPWEWAVAVGLISTGLYGFGMSLNDIIDRRRDTRIKYRVDAEICAWHHNKQGDPFRVRIEDFSLTSNSPAVAP